MLIWPPTSLPRQNESPAVTGTRSRRLINCKERDMAKKKPTAAHTASAEIIGTSPVSREAAAKSAAETAAQSCADLLRIAEVSKPRREDRSAEQGRSPLPRGFPVVQVLMPGTPGARPNSNRPGIDRACDATHAIPRRRDPGRAGAHAAIRRGQRRQRAVRRGSLNDGKVLRPDLAHAAGKPVRSAPATSAPRAASRQAGQRRVEALHVDGAEAGVREDGAHAFFSSANAKGPGASGSAGAGVMPIAARGGQAPSPTAFSRGRASTTNTHRPPVRSDLRNMAEGRRRVG